MNIPGLAPTGIHSQLEHVFGLSAWPRQPKCVELNRLWADAAVCVDGKPLRFVPQDARLPFPELNYAQRIAHAGLIATRADNWHDVFNALTWLSFPQTKLALTRRLADDSGIRGARARSPEHNALTLFDECAVVLAVSDPALEGLHAAHDWQHLFVDHRDAFGKRIVPVVFGHGFYDQARNPYLGLTAKAWYEAVPHSWLSQPTARLQSLLDERLALTVPGRLTSPRQLLPLPALGIPGWWQANTDPAFYDNVDYFRPATA